MRPNQLEKSLDCEAVSLTLTALLGRIQLVSKLLVAFAESGLGGPTEDVPGSARGLNRRTARVLDAGRSDGRYFSTHEFATTTIVGLAFLLASPAPCMH